MKHYNSYKEWKKDNPREYKKAVKNGWLDEICKLNGWGVIGRYPNRKPPGYWTKERCHEEALKYNSRDTFQRAVKGAYKSAMINGWLDDICSHMVRTWNKRK